MNKKKLLFGAWIVLLAGLAFAVSRMSTTVIEDQQKPPPSPKVNVAMLAKRWPEIIQHAAGPPRGSASPAYTLVEFGDFQCPQCGKMRPLIEKSVAASGEQANLYFVHRPFPIMHKYALAAAQASAAAAKDGKFWPMYDVLYSHQDDLEPGYYDNYAKEAGLDGPKVLSAVQSNTYLPQINADSQFCDGLGVVTTPTIALRDNKSGVVTVAAGADEITKMLKGSPWSARSAGVPPPAAPVVKSVKL